MHELLLWPAHGISFAFEIRFHMFLQKRRFAAQLKNKRLKIQNSKFNYEERYSNHNRNSAR